jgi:hypothetical protein
MENFLIRGEWHQTHLFSESQIFNGEGTEMLQFAIDFIGESVLSVFAHFLFLSILIDFEADVREINVVQLHECEVSQRAGLQ